MKTVHNVPEVEREFGLWQRMKARLTDVLGKLNLIQNSRTLDRKADRLRDAEALLDDRPMGDDGAERLATLAELQKERVVIPAAIALAKDRYEQEVQRAGVVILEEGAAEMEAAAQSLGGALEAVAEAVERFEATHAALEDAGAPVSSAYPAIYLSSLRASDPNSWVNEVHDDLERDYGVSVKREVLDRAEKERERVHLAEQKEKQHSGHARYAGPEGSGVFLKGGKRKPNPHEPGVLLTTPPMIPGNSPAVAR